MKERGIYKDNDDEAEEHGSDEDGSDANSSDSNSSDNAPLSKRKRVNKI